MTRTWSPFQKDIFNFVANGSGNAIVEAVAGSGKTTTIVEAMKLVRGSTIFLAFNKAIAEELKSRGVNARTFHSLVFSPVMNAYKQRNVDTGKLNFLMRTEMTSYEKRVYGGFAMKLVGLARQVGIGCLIKDEDSAWIHLCNHHGIEPEHDEADFGEGIAAARKLFDLCNESPVVDFDDMMYRAVKDQITLPKFDAVFVDEAQDTNAIQRAVLHKLMTPHTRLIAVGDPAQAIYGFRGSDSDSLKLIAEEFNAVTLPLSISYRCPTSVIRYAQQYVSHIQAREDAPSGSVNHLDVDWQPTDFKPGDLVVSRKTGPLIRLAFKFIKSQIPVTVLGREIGDGLKAIVNKLGETEMEPMLQRLKEWRDREYHKAIKEEDEGKAESILDKAEAIDSIAENLFEDNRTLEMLFQGIDFLFANKRDAVIMATIHKSKGLESKTVWWLGASECPATWAKKEWQKQQEVNLCYVAITRAIETLNTFEMSPVQH